MQPHDRHSQRGQVLVLFALALSALVLGTAVVVDGGYAFAQRRATQNAADFAALAGTRIVGMAKIGQAAGTAANVRDAIDATLEANDAHLVSAQYVDGDGYVLDDVDAVASIPSRAFGVVVDARTDWHPFLLGVIGVTDWAASARATAKTPGESLGGGVLPVGIHEDRYEALSACSLVDINSCINRLTSGQLYIPGGFGWLSFGLQPGKQQCGWDDSLQMTESGCEQNRPALQRMIDQTEVHGCCGPVDEAGSADKIGSFTGNTWGDLSYYIDGGENGTPIPVWVPIWTGAGAQGANGFYDIVGFGAIIFTGQDKQHGRWLEGAAVDAPCPIGWDVEGQRFCKGPGGAFTLEATGEAQLER
jgi:hypothetical protein